MSFVKPVEPISKLPQNKTDNREPVNKKTNGGEPSPPPAETFQEVLNKTIQERKK
jgi:hypothetical protein